MLSQHTKQIQHFVEGDIPIGRSGGGARQKLFRFHVVFLKFWQNGMLVPPGCSPTPPPPPLDLPLLSDSVDLIADFAKFSAQSYTLLNRSKKLEEDEKIVNASFDAGADPGFISPMHGHLVCDVFLTDP